MKSIVQMGLAFYCLLGPVIAQHPLDKSLVAFSPGKYVAPHEVSNADYRDFLEKNPELEGMEVDSMAWLDLAATNKPYVENYHRHPAFLPYPVMNVSYAQAQAYCAWLTEHYN
ncbi:MAG: SUMF1/EgtB/PvdO family nonheme iron enzyme, partial [Bacteroidota bacterium]